MVDPISITGLVISIAQVCWSTDRIIRGLKEAPEDIREFNVDLPIFASFLDDIVLDFRNETFVAETLLVQAMAALRQAKATVEALKEGVDDIKNSNRTEILRIKWVYNKTRFSELRQGILEHLNLLQNIVCNIRTRRMEASLRRTDANVTKVRHYLARPRPFCVEAIEQTGGDSQLIISSSIEVDKITRVKGPLPLTDIGKEGCASEIHSSTTKVERTAKLQEEACEYDCHTEEVIVSGHVVAKSSTVMSKSTFRFTKSSTVDQCRVKTQLQQTAVAASRMWKKVAVTTNVLRGFTRKIYISFKPPTPCGRVVDETSEVIKCVLSGNLPRFKQLIETGQATINDMTNDRWSVLHNAGFHGKRNFVVYLIQKGADTELTEVGNPYRNRTASHLARTRALDLNSTQAQKDIADAFPDAFDYKGDFQFSPLHIATMGMYDENDHERPNLSTLLDLVEEANNAAENENWAAWKSTFRQPNYEKSKDGKRSPLFREILGLFQKEADKSRRLGKNVKPFFHLINQRDAVQGWSPLQWAVQTGRLESMNVLLERLADPFVPTSMKRNIIHQAVVSKDPGVLRRALEIEPCGSEKLDIDLQDAWSETPLHLASMYTAECIEILLSKGARRDIKRGDGVVALHYSAWAEPKERLGVVDLLSSDQGPHINFQEDTGKSPIFDLLQWPECIKLLLARTASTSLRDTSGKSTLHHACIENQPRSLQLLLEAAEGGIAISADNDGKLPLEFAFELNRPECAMILLNVGAIGDLNSKDGWPLAHRAAKMGDAQVLEFCFTHPKFKPAVLNKDGDSVYKVACEAGTFKTLKELILRYERKWHSPTQDDDP